MPAGSELLGCNRLQLTPAATGGPAVICACRAVTATIGNSTSFHADFAGGVTKQGKTIY